MTQLAELGIKIEADDIKSAVAELRRLERQGGKAEKAVKGLTSKMKAFAVAASAAAVASAIARHTEFTAAISDLSAITGATGKDLQFYNDQAREIGSTTTLSAIQAAEAFKLIASAKPDLLENKEALAAVTKEVVTLAEASGLAMPEAANAVGSALNQFGAGAEEASRFVNVLAAGAKFGASEISDTAEALRVAGTVASNAGLSFEETNSAIQAMANVALKGSEAGTGLRGVLLKLSSQSRDEFNPEVVGFTTALKNLEKANLTTTQKTKLFGQESITAANALIKEADNLGTMTSKLTGTATAQEQAAAKTDNLADDTKRMGAAWEDVALTLGNTFDPAMRATVTLIGEGAKVAKSLTLAFSDIGDALGAYAAAAAAVFSGDFAGAKTILKMRDEQLAATNIAIDKIWEEKKATDELNKAKGETPDVKPQNKPQKVKIDTKAASKAASALEKQNADIRASALEAQAIIADIDPVFKAGLAWDGYVELVEGGYLTMEQAAEKYAQEFGEKSNDIAKTGTDDFKRLEDAVRGWGNKFTDTMATMVRTGKVDFGSLADSIINDLIRIQVQQRITDPLISAGTSILSSIDFGSMFSFAGGGSTGSGARSGGVDGIGGFPAILHPNETVIDHTKSQSAHGGDTYIIDARGADHAAISRLENLIILLNGSIERRAVGAVNGALMSRGQRAIA